MFSIRFHNCVRLVFTQRERYMRCYYSLCAGNQCLLMNWTLIYHVMILYFLLHPCDIWARARVYVCLHVWFLLTETLKKNIYIYQSSLSISTYGICGIARRRHTFSSTLYQNLEINYAKGNIHWKSYAYVTSELYSVKQMLLLLLLMWIPFRPISRARFKIFTQIPIFVR